MDCWKHASNLPSHKIAYFGGTFDPVHHGHLAVARDALQYLNLDHVYFLPAQRSPHKRNAPVASFNRRVEMLKLALESFPKLSVSTLESALEPPVYTVEIVQKLAREHPNAELFWMMGADQLPRLGEWHRIDELVSRVTFLVFSRPGYVLDEAALPDLPGACYECFTGADYDISSSQIRAALHSTDDCSQIIPEKVLAYIRKHHLYSHPHQSNIDT